MRVYYFFLLISISLTQIVFGQENQVKKNDLGDLVIITNENELDCFYRSALKYNCDYTYYVFDNKIYFLGCSFIDFPSNGNMEIIYSFERFSILNCKVELKIELKESVNKDNRLRYIISETGFLIKYKNNLEIERISVTDIDNKYVFH
ncbi:hypothetical protein [Flavobacterium sp. N1719]|uniref:hypothetical protein n=1 Tax=Flavobacterium sp. N1719 TaxID=2885633 RepID=UPI00222320A3|nr:hypothetical protein [Flavobacterium sp. N1719]